MEVSNRVWDTAAWFPPCPFFVAIALTQSVQKLVKVPMLITLQELHATCLPPLFPLPACCLLWRVHCLTIVCQGAPCVPSIARRGVLTIFCLGALVVLSIIWVYQLFSYLSCCPICFLYRLSWCQCCSFISSGVPTTLSSVLVSWYIICSDVPSARSIICPGVLVYHMFWCPVCSIYHLSWCPSGISYVLKSRLLDLSSVLVSFWYIICSDVPSARSIICPGALRV